mgnify:CR=1 FL=1
MSDKKYFPKGFIFKHPHPKAPDFVNGSVSIKVDEFKSYLNNVKGEWLNIDLKTSKEGKAYAEVNTFKPEKKSKEIPNDFDSMSDNLPF